MTTGRIPSVDGGIQPTIIDAAGDLIYGASNDTPARLAIGTAGQVLAVNSGATAPEWASVPTGSLTLLSTTTLAAATTQISGISGAYKNLAIHIYGATWDTSDQRLQVSFNNLTNNNTYIRSASGSSVNQQDDTRLQLTQGATNAVRTTGNNVAWIKLYDYASASEWKPVNFSGINDRSGGGDEVPFFGFGGCITTAAITSVEISNSGATTFTGGTVKIYGVN